MSRRRGLDPRVRVPVHLGSAGAALLIVVLRIGTGMPWVHAATLGVLLVLLPALSVAQVRLLDSLELERIPAYLSSLLTLLVLGAWAWIAGAVLAEPPFVALVWLPMGTLASWVAGLTVAGLAVMALFRRIAMGLGLAESRVLRDLLPRTKAERAWFLALSAAAGLGEETAYRGFVIPLLAGVVGVPLAAGVSSLVFGVLHAYQGALGMVRTAVLGGLLAWGFLASGSLIPVILAHALLDVVAGVVLGERLMVPVVADGVIEEDVEGRAS